MSENGMSSDLPLSYRCSLTITIESKGQFAGGKVDPVEAGKQGGKASGGTGSAGGDSASGAQGADYKPTEHDGLRKDGQPDGRVKGN